MEQALLDTIAMLTKKFDDLLVIQDANTVEDDGTDHYVSNRALARDLQAYPRLMEVLPSIEVDFFRSPLSDEEKRDIVQSSPRTVDMIYTPPPINDAATAPIKKLDTAYYNVQAFLAQDTRPVDYYMHQLLQDEPEAPTNDPRFLFPTKPGGKKPFRGRQQQASSETAPKTVTIAAMAPVTNQTNLADGSNQQFANYTGGFRGGRGGGRGSARGRHQ
ncbi:hypothetical protein AYI69_g9421 [Smittium culicis]|uniref:Uncharacterized protein n=1 Tax=Smittium culicis TaxID=133412 RepID=A0A1R1XCM5_9FUNG|nr:hypothetical protein AYI69_g9421 [Smittium culicis]